MTRTERHISAILIACHLVALLFGGGFAVATSRAVLRVGQWDGAGRRRTLIEIHAIHRPVLVAAGVLVLSGAALTGAHPDRFLTSPLFLLKLLLLCLLGVNGLVLIRTEGVLRSLAGATPAEQGDRWLEEQQLWWRLRVTACLSLVLWSATTILGALLPSPR